MSLLTSSDIQTMVLHWISTPCGTYLGNNYGNNFSDYLQSPIDSPGADAIVAKLLNDVPVLSGLGGNAVSMHSIDNGADTVRYVITLAGLVFEVPPNAYNG